MLTLSTWQTKTSSYVNTVDQDEMAHQDLHCLPFCVWFFSEMSETPICSIGLVQIQGWKSPLQKLRDESVNTETGTSQQIISRFYCQSLKTIKKKKNIFTFAQTSGHTSANTIYDFLMLSRVQNKLDSTENTILQYQSLQLP